MKSFTATLVALATVLASPVYAASAKHRSPAVQAGANAFGQFNSGPYSNTRAGDTVVFGNRVIGQDPDPNIRTQMLHDPVSSDY